MKAKTLKTKTSSRKQNIFLEVYSIYVIYIQPTTFKNISCIPCTFKFYIVHIIMKLINSNKY